MTKIEILNKANKHVNSAIDLMFEYIQLTQERSAAREKLISAALMIERDILITQEEGEKK